MQREIKGACPSIDCVKIGLHLQLSYCCCLFVLVSLVILYTEHCVC